jgi:hypothetical protein
MLFDAVLRDAWLAKGSAMMEYEVGAVDRRHL